MDLIHDNWSSDEGPEISGTVTEFVYKLPLVTKPLQSIAEKLGSSHLVTHQIRWNRTLLEIPQYTESVNPTDNRGEGL